MSPKLETLDQLLGGDTELMVVFGLSPDADRFARGMAGLLHSGDTAAWGGRQGKR